MEVKMPVAKVVQEKEMQVCSASYSLLGSMINHRSAASGNYPASSKTKQWHCLISCVVIVTVRHILGHSGKLVKFTKGRASWENKGKGEFWLASRIIIAEQLQSWTMVIPSFDRNGSKHLFQLCNSRNNCDLTEVGLILIGMEAACRVIVLKNIINYCHYTARSSIHNLFLELESFYNLV